MNLCLRLAMSWVGRRVFTPPDPPVAVAWQSVTANGSDGATTSTQLTFTFDVDPGELSAANFTIDWATKGTMTGTGTTRVLPISDITADNNTSQTVTLASNPSGYTITPTSRSVTVYVQDITVEWQSLTANGTPGEATTTELTLEFDADPGPLTTGSFILFNADITGISGTGTGRVLTINNVVDSALTLSVTSPTGYAISPDERSVTANIEDTAPNEITFISGEANGESDVTTSNSITLTFSEDPTGLAASDITVTGATKGALSGSGTTRALAISSLSVDDSQTVNVAIADNNDNTFSPNNRDVTVYVEAAEVDVAWNSLTANGSASSGSTSRSIPLFNGTNSYATIVEFLNIGDKVRFDVITDVTEQSANFMDRGALGGNRIDLYLTSSNNIRFNSSRISVKVDGVAVTDNTSIADKMVGEVFNIEATALITLPLGQIGTNTSIGGMFFQGSIFNMKIDRTANGGAISPVWTMDADAATEEASVGSGTMTYSNVTWGTLEVAGETEIVPTTELTFGFDVDPGELTASDISVAWAAKGTLSGTGTERVLSVSSLTADNEESVAVGITNPSGYSITPTSRNVTVYVDGTAPIASGTFAPPAGNVDSTYFYDASALFTGGTPVSYALATGSLPAGLSFNTSTGVFSGTPTTEETEAGLSVSATNVEGTDTTNTASIVINEELPAGEIVVPWESNYNYLPIGADNLSVIPDPPVGARIVYIDEIGGNDGTAQNYAVGDVDDWRTPTGTINAYETVTAAEDQIRMGQADYLLFKRGGEFECTDQINPVRGPSVANRSVISWWGDPSDPMPKLISTNPSALTATSSVINFFDNSNTRGNCIIQGLEFPNVLRDPAHPDFVGWGNITTGIQTISVRASNPINGVIIEGCKIMNSGFHGIILSEVGGAITDTIIRRNFIGYGYSPSAVSHSIGIGVSFASAIVEENVLMKNGYSEAVGSTATPTIFNHNMYLTNTHQSIIRNNISIGPSSQHRKFTANVPSGQDNSIRAEDVAIYGNIDIYGGIVSAMGGNDSNDDGPRFKNFWVRKNVAQYIGKVYYAQDLAWGIDFVEHVDSDITGNLFLDIDNGDITNKWWIRTSLHMEDVSITGNIVRDFGGSIINSTSPGPYTNTGNYIDADPSTFVDPDKTVEGYLVENSLGTTVDDFIDVLESDYLLNTYAALDPKTISAWYFAGFALA